MQILRNKLIEALPNAERATLLLRLANVQATIRERLRLGHACTSLNATARDLKAKLKATD